ncbi:MAG TPA: transglycosylase family protein [Solirubrobacterales bacterium]|nr:transglycosylase family protein [Solirubrobacterales bacterium]
MPPSIATEVGARRGRGALVGLAAACSLIFATGAAADSGSLQAKVGAARSQAGALAAELQAKQGQLAAAQEQAAAASARERQLDGLLANGQRRAVELAARVGVSRRHLFFQQARLHRARGDLAQRLVAMYESGSPSAAGVVLGASSFKELVTRTEYLREVQSADNDLAQRVAQVRDEVRRALALVSELEARVRAYDSQLGSARTQISGVRQSAEASASRLQSIASARAASLADLKSNIGNWVGEIQAARSAAAEEASRSSAESIVERWLGGPYSIPPYIVMCESGGNYAAVNPSSGAGGAYQILPSTWRLYGGQGTPQDAPKAEQDSIASKIWAASGPSAWVCGGG